jgi:hypothetical protein
MNQSKGTQRMNKQSTPYRRRSFLSLSFALGFVVASQETFALDAVAGLGLQNHPSAPGSDEQRFDVVPLLDIKYEHWIATTLACKRPMLGAFWKDEGSWGEYLFVAGGSLSDDRLPDDADILEGQRRISMHLNPGIYTEWNIPPGLIQLRLEANVDPWQNSWGADAIADVVVRLPIMGPLGVQFPTGIHAMNTAGCSRWFSSRQVAQTGVEAFAAKGGIEDFHTGFEGFVKLHEHWMLIFSGTGRQYLADARKSPLTQKSWEVEGVLGVVYKW